MYNNLMKNIQELVNRGFNASDLLFKKKDKKDKFKKVAASAHHHVGQAHFWRKIVFIGVFPAIALLFAKTFFLFPHEPERPKFVPYTYLRIRNKRFPWGEGQRSLFHNKHMNPLKDGYED